MTLTRLAPFIKEERLGVVAHALNPRTWEAEALRSQASESLGPGGLLAGARPEVATQLDPDLNKNK